MLFRIPFLGSSPSALQPSSVNRFASAVKLSIKPETIKRLAALALASSLVLLAGCSSSQKLPLKSSVTLKPEDIPSLYQSPTLADTSLGEVSAEDALASIDQAAKEMADQDANLDEIKPEDITSTELDGSNSASTEQENEQDNQELATVEDSLNDCDKIGAEIALIDQGLGQKAEDSAPQAKATAGQRVGSYFKDLALETIKGPFQPIIQSVRAATNADEKDRVRAEAVNRGSVRRAYLMGYSEGLGCSAKTDDPQANSQ